MARSILITDANRSVSRVSVNNTDAETAVRGRGKLMMERWVNVEGRTFNMAQVAYFHIGGNWVYAYFAIGFHYKPLVDDTENTELFSLRLHDVGKSEAECQELIEDIVRGKYDVVQRTSEVENIAKQVLLAMEQQRTGEFNV